ncbi:MAG: hypothetical protein R2709_10535 [Marmoricola sp.]
MMNPALYAMRMLQRNLTGSAEELHLSDESDVQTLIDDVRAEA